MLSHVDAHDEGGEDFIMCHLPDLLSLRGVTRSDQPAVKPDTCFPVYPTSADAKSDLNNALRI